MIDLPPTLDPFGLTLAEYAAARHTNPQAVRADYRTIMRNTDPSLLPEITRRTDDTHDTTTKFCLPAGTSNTGGANKKLETESVIIPMTSFGGTTWHTLCLSSQVGCRMACTFCETGRMGLLKNLTPSEIVKQRLVARTLRNQATNASTTTTKTFRYFSDGIQNIVFMGMGEPLDNLDNVIQAIRVLTEPAGLSFPHTQITVSTVGRIDGLQKLATLARAEPLWKNLRIAISLNAATDRLRNELMPINKAMPLADLKQTLLDYPLAPRGRFLIEYVLIKDINDSPADAGAVAHFCRDLPCIVNLIPYNPQHFAAYETSPEEKIMAFLQDLRSQKIFTKRRVTHGRELMGACGQLGNPEIRRTPTPRNPLPVIQ